MEKYISLCHSSPGALLSSVYPNVLMKRLLDNFIWGAVVRGQISPINSVEGEVTVVWGTISFSIKLEQEITLEMLSTSWHGQFSETRFRGPRWASTKEHWNKHEFFFESWSHYCVLGSQRDCQKVLFPLKFPFYFNLGNSVAELFQGVWRTMNSCWAVRSEGSVLYLRPIFACRN